MSYEDLLIKAMTWDYPESIPASVYVLPATHIKYKGELLEVLREFPQFFGEVADSFKIEDIYFSSTYRLGKHTDEWGCVWENIEEGMNAYVTGHPVPKRGDILSLKIPENRDGAIPHGFMYLRLLDLRGFEEAMLDFAEECDELQILIDKVTEHNCIQTEVAATKPGRVAYFGDDLGMQKGLAIGPVKWRKYLKPSFKKIFEIARSVGKLVFMHTDGMIYEIIPDLFEAGVSMVNPQYRANGLSNLVRVCKGRYPILLDMDRQLYPFATPDECSDHVKRCVEAFYLPEGGFGFTIEFGPDVPLKNIRAMLRAAEEYRHYK